MKFIERLCSNNKDNNLGFNAIIHTWIIIIILFITLFHLLISRINITVKKYEKNETINSNEMWNNFLFEQTHIFNNNNNSNGIELKLAQSNTSTSPSINYSINTNNNNHSQLEGNTEIKNNKYNNTKSKYDLNASATPAALHPNNFGLSYSSINNIDLDLNVNDVICHNVKSEQMRSCETEGLADGASVAGGSSLDIALSVLEYYLSTVVGVALSASLLQPAVTGGMLTSFVTFKYIINIPINKRYINNKRLLTIAGWSVLLTIESIIIIFVISRFIFYIKNVNPQIWKSVTNYNRRNRIICNGHF